MTTGEIIKERRKALGLTQDDLAKKMGYKSREAISSVERNKEDLTTDRIRKFAHALNCAPADLMGDWVPDRPFRSSTGQLALLIPDIDETALKCDLNYDEAKLLVNYRKLSENGKNKVLERIDELMQLEGVNA